MFSDFSFIVGYQLFSKEVTFRSVVNHRVEILKIWNVRTISGHSGGSVHNACQMGPWVGNKFSHSKNVPVCFIGSHYV